MKQVGETVKTLVSEALLQNPSNVSVRSSVQATESFPDIHKASLTPRIRGVDSIPGEGHEKELSNFILEDPANKMSASDQKLQPPLLRNKSKSLRSIVKCKVETLSKFGEPQKIKTSTFAREQPKENVRSNCNDEVVTNTRTEIRLPSGFITQPPNAKQISYPTQKETPTTIEQRDQTTTRQVLQPIDTKHEDKIDLSPINNVQEESPLCFPIAEFKGKLEFEGESSLSKNFEEPLAKEADRSKVSLSRISKCQNKNANCESSELMYDCGKFNCLLLGGRDVEDYEEIFMIKEESQYWEAKFKKCCKKLVKFKKLYDYHFNSLQLVLHSNKLGAK